jgi:hypothetical protein
VKEMFPEELMNLVVIVKLSTSLLKMLNPIETGVLDLERKKLINEVFRYVNHKRAGSPLSANILLKGV